MEFGPFIIVFVVAVCVTVLLIPFAERLSYRWGVVSKPGGRRLENRPMPKLGGIAIFGGFIVAIIFAQALPVVRLDPNEITRFIGLLLGSTFIFIFGILDDIFEFDYVTQFLGQIVASVIAMLFLIFIETFTNPFNGLQVDPWHPIITAVLTLFWLTLMMNTVNFLDGLDGLAGGVAFISGIMLFVISAFRVEPPQTSVSLLPLALAGSCLGFLFYNFHPAKIYMGGGAVLLGYLLGTLSIIGGAKMATILLVMGLPLIDLIWQAITRLRSGNNPFVGDRGHLHFRLLDSKMFTYRQIVSGYYLFCSFFGVLALVTKNQLFKFGAFCIMVTFIIAGFMMLIRLRQRENQSSKSS